MRIESGTIDRVSLGPGQHGAAWGTIVDREVFVLRLTDELGRSAEGEVTESGRATVTVPVQATPRMNSLGSNVVA